MATGNCPICRNRATLRKCDACGEVRCISSVSGSGCGAKGKGGHKGHKCHTCNKGKYQDI